MADEVKMDEGRLAGIRIQMETVEDNFEKAIAQYDYPFADGADLDDLGQKAHMIKVRCHFWDDAEQQTYDDHAVLVNILESKDLLDFIHPKYGLIKGKIQTITVNHNDDIRHAVVDITFVEQMRQIIEAAAAQSVLSATEEAYQSGQVQQEEMLANDIRASIPTADYGAVSTILDAGTGLLAQMQGFSGITRDFVAQIEKNISAVEAVVNEIESPLNTLQATIVYSSTLPGRILGSLSGAIEKVALLYQSLLNYPSQYIGKVDQAFDELQDSFDAFSEAATSNGGESGAAVMARHLKIACAQRIALEAAHIYAADEEAFKNGNNDFQVMNINELEATLAIVRTRIEAALSDAREMDCLKTMAAALLTQVNAVRLEREKMISVTLANPMPLHLVCLKYGLSYTDAERLLKANKYIQNPNFTSGEIYVYG